MNSNKKVFEELISLTKKLTKPVHINIYDYDNTIVYTEKKGSSIVDKFSQKIFGKNLYSTIRSLSCFQCGTGYFVRHRNIQNNNELLYLSGLLNELVKKEKLNIINDEIKKEIILFFIDNLKLNDKKYSSVSFIYEYFNKLNIEQKLFYSKNIYHNDKMNILSNILKESQIFNISVDDFNKLLFTNENINYYCSNALKIIDENIQCVNDYISKKNFSHYFINFSKENEIINELNGIKNYISDFMTIHNKQFDDNRKKAKDFYLKIFYPLLAYTEIFQFNCELNYDLIKKMSKGVKEGRINIINSLRDYESLKNDLLLFVKFSDNDNLVNCSKNLLSDNNGLYSVFGTDDNKNKYEVTRGIYILNHKSIYDNVIFSLKNKYEQINNNLNLLNKCHNIDQNILKKFEEDSNYFKYIVDSYKEKENDINEINDYINNFIIINNRVVKVNFIGDNYNSNISTDFDSYINIYNESYNNILINQNISPQRINAIRNMDIKFIIESKYVFRNKLVENNRYNINDLIDEVKNQIIIGKNGIYSNSFNNKDYVKRFIITLRMNENNELLCSLPKNLLPKDLL